MKRLPLAALICLLLCATPAAAGLFSADPPGDFLPVDQAFSANVITDESQLLVRWDITDGYYLYRHALKFELVGNSGAALDQPQIPAGEKHEDEFFGEVETYRHQLTVTLPFTLGSDGAQPAQLQIQYQGCADAGLCYPPQTRILDLGAGAAATGGSEPVSADPFVAEQDYLAGLLNDGNLLWTLLSFLGLGVLLAFTPCVLPMIPILSGIIVGRGHSSSAWRGFSLSCVYVVSMALAYTFFGVLAGLFGANLQAALQSPWVLVPFAGVFALLALAMFGAFQLQLPGALQTRLNRVGQGASGSLAGAGIMGFASALVVGPCLAPPLAGALLYIGNTGNAVLGGAALFALGMGMGLPLIVLGTAGGGALPKAGPWMDQIKILFGVILLGVAIWLLTRVLPGPVALVLWSVLLAGYGVHLGALEPARDGTARLAKAGGVLGLVYAAILLVGAAMGAANPLRPLQGLAVTGTSARIEQSSFRRVDGLAELRAALAAAKAEQRPSIVDFYADWCVECVQMERTVFNTDQVRDALDSVVALQVDVSRYDAADRELLKALGVIGPPTILFFDSAGAEQKNYRLVGAIDAPGLVTHLRRALGI